MSGFGIRSAVRSRAAAFWSSWADKSQAGCNAVSRSFPEFLFAFRKPDIHGPQRMEHRRSAERVAVGHWGLKPPAARWPSAKKVQPGRAAVHRPGPRTTSERAGIDIRSSSNAERGP